MPDASSPTAAASTEALLEAAARLRDAVSALAFAPPVAHVYNPLAYAWAPHALYLERYGAGPKRVVFLGMNPGPFGMMQTGVPFGEVAAVRDWMGIEAPVDTPPDEHPKRRISGFACTRSEVSGRRLWGWAARRFGSPQAFFAQAFVLNWCPLVFLEESGRNRTPDQLPVAELRALQAACDDHLAHAVLALSPQWRIGVGGFAEKRLRLLVEGERLPSDVARRLKVGQILHPSPASPAANRGWAPQVDAQLARLGVFAD